MSVLGKRTSLDLVELPQPKYQKVSFMNNFGIYFTFYNDDTDERVISFDLQSNLGDILKSTELFHEDSILINIHEGIQFHGIPFVEDAFIQGYESIGGTATIKSAGIEMDVHLVYESFYDGEWIKLPDNWVMTDKFLKEGFDKVKLGDLGFDESESVISEFGKTADKDILKTIYRIQHLENYCRYTVKSKSFAVKRNMFHGTGKTDPDMVAKSGIVIGDHTKFGLWGKGVYFAENASYSNLYSHINQGSHYMFLVEVCFEKPCIIKHSAITHQYTAPPDGYDCVIGASHPGTNHNFTSTILTLYEPDRNLIRYEIKYDI